MMPEEDSVEEVEKDHYSVEEHCSFAEEENDRCSVGEHGFEPDEFGDGRLEDSSGENSVHKGIDDRYGGVTNSVCSVASAEEQDIAHPMISSTLSDVNMLDGTCFLLDFGWDE